MAIRHAAVAAAVSIGLVVGLVAPASAGRPEMDRQHVVFVDPDQDICGVNIDVHVDVRFFDKAFFDDGNFVRFLGNASGSNTFVNDAGEFVKVTFANTTRATEVVDEAAGTLTITYSIRGLPEKIIVNGRPVSLDAGLITFTDVIDLATDELISTEIVTVHGPHPEAEGGFNLFCEVIRSELG